IAALHAVRPVRGALASPYDVDAARLVLGAAGAGTLQMVERRDAVYVLKEAVHAAFPQQELSFADTRPPADWQWRLTPYGPKRHWRALRLVPPRQRARVLLRLIWPTNPEMRV